MQRWKELVYIILMLYLILNQGILLSKWLRETNLGREEEIEVEKADLNVIMFLLYGDICQNCGAGSENGNGRIVNRVISKENKSYTQVLEND